MICSCINLMDVVHYSHLLYEQPVSTAMHLRTPQVQSFGYKLHSAAQIVTISSNLSKSKMGISCFNILNVLSRRIACSTKILKFATSFVFVTSSFLICSLPLFPGGMCNWQWLSKRSSAMVNPLSAVTSSAYSRMS